MATNPTPQPDFLSTLKREAAAFGQAFNPANALTALYHAASDPARSGEDADFERRIGPTGRLIDRTVVQPARNAIKDYAGGKVSYDDVLQNLPEALGAAGGAAALGGVINSAAGSTPIGPAPFKSQTFVPPPLSAATNPAVSEIPPSLKAVIGPKLTSTGEISWPESYKNPPAGGGGNYSAQDLEALKAKMGLSSPQGGHAGNGVASVEELSRPGQHYVVSRTGALTFHGKSFAPEATPSRVSPCDGSRTWGISGK